MTGKPIYRQHCSLHLFGSPPLLPSNPMRFQRVILFRPPRSPPTPSTTDLLPSPFQHDGFSPSNSVPVPVVPGETRLSISALLFSTETRYQRVALLWPPPLKLRPATCSLLTGRVPREPLCSGRRLFRRTVKYFPHGLEDCGHPLHRDLVGLASSTTSPINPRYLPRSPLPGLRDTSLSRYLRSTVDPPGTFALQVSLGYHPLPLRTPPLPPPPWRCHQVGDSNRSPHSLFRRRRPPDPVFLFPPLTGPKPPTVLQPSQPQFTGTHARWLPPTTPFCWLPWFASTVYHLPGYLVLFRFTFFPRETFVRRSNLPSSTNAKQVPPRFPTPPSRFRRHTCDATTATPYPNNPVGFTI